MRELSLAQVAAVKQAGSADSAHKHTAATADNTEDSCAIL